MKKLFCVLTTICLLFSAFPLTVFAVGNDGNSVISPALQEQMDKSGESDIIPTYVWYTEITDEDIQKVMDEITPFTTEAYFNHEPIPYDTIREKMVQGGFPEFAPLVERSLGGYLKGWENVEPKDFIIDSALGVVQYDLKVETYKARTDRYLSDYNIDEEQVVARTDYNPVFIVDATTEKIKALAKDQNTVKLDWFSHDFFDYYTYHNRDNPFLLSVSCMCISPGLEGSYPGINCYHHANERYEIFRWLGDQDRMADFKNDIDSIPDCFGPRTTNNFPTGRVLFLDGVPNLGDYLFFFERKVKDVYIPNSVTEIGEHTFSLFSDIRIHCYSGSYAEQFAISHKFECHLLDTGETHEVLTRRGDANDDGERNLKDVLALRKAIALGVASGLKGGADCNNDGSYDTKDVLMLRQYFADMYV